MFKTDMNNNQSFAKKYPNLANFVFSQGKIEIGYDETTPFVIAYDEGGTVSSSLEEAFHDLETGISQYLTENDIDLNE